MKKFLALFLAMLMMFTVFTACGKTTANNGATTTAKSASDTYEIALITDVGNIDDQSFNQGTWEGVKAYAADNNVTYAYYRPTEDSTEARIETIKNAIAKGAKVVVCPGYLFGEALATVQADYPNVYFLGIDVSAFDMVDANGDSVAIAKNVALITYQEEQAGYLAGYAIVKDGYKKLGFLGGMAVPAVIRYGYGFVQGANDAAKELGITKDVKVNYWYSGSFAPTDDIQTKTAGWYTAGTEVVFACGGGIYLSATAAAKAAGKKVIGVDVDQANQSDTIITSAMKELKNSVVVALGDFYKNNKTWSATYAGKNSVLGAAQACVGLPTATASWRFKTFTVAEYNTLFDKVKKGEVTISNSSDTAKHPDVSITVDYIG